MCRLDGSLQSPRALPGDRIGRRKALRTEHAGAAVGPLVLPLRWRAVLSPCYPALCFEIPKMELKGFSRFTENGSGSAVSSLMIAGRECLHREERLSISVWYRSRH